MTDHAPLHLLARGNRAVVTLNVKVYKQNDALFLSYSVERLVAGGPEGLQNG
ncbi:MAG: hypothetical protein IPO97_13080 [Sphingomonadales bacterium]|nr:hypothetical protein [Sphingomonadales bacterium]